MHYKDIWDFAEDNHIGIKRREKRYVRISREDFEYIRPFFHQRFNFLRPATKSYRTCEGLFHLHALDKKGYVEIHLDLANVDQQRLLMFVPHFALDVVPFFLGHIAILCLKILATPKYIAVANLRFFRWIKRRFLRTKHQ